MFNRTFLKALPLYGILTLFLSSCMLFSASSLQNPALRIILPTNNARAAWNQADFNRISNYQVTLTKDTEIIGPKSFVPGSEVVFTFDELEAGTWNVTVIALIDEDEFARGQADAVIREGETTPVEITMTVAEKFLNDETKPDTQPDTTDQEVVEPPKEDPEEPDQKPEQQEPQTPGTSGGSQEIVFPGTGGNSGETGGTGGTISTGGSGSTGGTSGSISTGGSEGIIVQPGDSGAGSTGDTPQTVSLKEFYGDPDNPGNISYTEFDSYSQIARLNADFSPQQNCTISNPEWWNYTAEYDQNTLFGQFTVHDDSKYVQYCKFVGSGETFALQLLYSDEKYILQDYGDYIPATVYGIGSCGILALITYNDEVQYYLFLTEYGTKTLSSPDITFELFSEKGLSVHDVTSSNLTLLFTDY